MATEEVKFQPKDYKSDQYVRWCPGCGDHAVLNCLHKAMAEVGVAPHNMAVISGIGCSSRLPYYMNTYGFHTIHGRGAAIATGVKTARPDLSVWLVTGDGDCLAIGGNHFIHAIRRNVDLNIVLFNNKIYGLTKGQYSPTSDRGFVSKSSPYGTVEDPFIPAELALGARGNFFARVIDVDLKNTTEVLAASARHKGASVTEVLVNCVIFNDGIHKKIVDKEFRADRTIFLRHGEKMYETLLTNEECAKAVDMGNFYRVPADNRGLNYDKYFKEGDEERNTLTEFNSNNTRRLNLEETKAKIASLSYIQEELEKMNSK